MESLRGSLRGRTHSLLPLFLVLYLEDLDARVLPLSWAIISGVVSMVWWVRPEGEGERGPALAMEKE